MILALPGFFDASEVLISFLQARFHEKSELGVDRILITTPAWIFKITVQKRKEEEL